MGIHEGKQQSLEAFHAIVSEAGPLELLAVLNKVIIINKFSLITRNIVVGVGIGFTLKVVYTWGREKMETFQQTKEVKNYLIHKIIDRAFFLRYYAKQISEVRYASILRRFTQPISLEELYNLQYELEEYYDSMIVVDYSFQ